MPELSEKKITYLRNTDLFSLCSESELKIISENSSFLAFKKGENIFSPGDNGAGLFIVEKGEIVIRKPDNENRMIDIALFLPGDCFGELDMFTSASRKADASAEIDSRLLMFPRKRLKFSSFLKKYPEVSARILHKFIVQISDRIRKTNSMVKENSPIIQELSKQVYIDKLTRLENKTSLEEKLKRMIASDDKIDKLYLIMFKPDNFKALNDTYGHDAGDMCLRIIAKDLKNFLPERFPLFRYMGNEMAVLLPDCAREEALETAEKLLDFIHGIDLSEAAGGSRFTLSASFGAAGYPEHASSSEELIQKAHQLPLIGRARGGNMILFPEDFEEPVDAGN